MRFTQESYCIKDLFNIDCPAECKTRILTDLSESDQQFVPKLNPDYVFGDSLKDVLNFLADPNGDSLYMFGPTGAGKTSTVMQVAARLNWPCMTITGSNAFELLDLLGFITVKDRNTIYQDGPLTTAMKRGYLFVLNEMDMINSGQLMGINDLLNNNQLVNQLNDCEVVRPHKFFRFIATGNTNGSGDRSGRYKGSQFQNCALMDRFRFISVDYMSQDDELNLLKKNYPEIPPEQLVIMVKVATTIRSLFLSKDRLLSIKSTLSTRTLLRWAHLYVTYRNAKDPFAYALDRAFTMRLDLTDRCTVSRILEDIRKDNDKKKD